MSGQIILGGQAYPIACRAHWWNSPDKSPVNPKSPWTIGKNCRARTQDINLAVWHWTGGEGLADRIKSTLLKRGYSVGFVIEPDETIVQFADPVLIASYGAGAVNPRALHVEMVNYGFRRKGKAVPKKGWGRDCYRTELNDKPRRFAKFTPSQLSSAMLLAELFSEVLDIPRRVPCWSNGKLIRSTLPKTLKGEPMRLDEPDKCVWPDTQSTFTGHCGHYHVSKAKSDPGTDLLIHLWALWSGRL